MKTPDEIKKALDCCRYLHPVCEECPYYPTFCKNVMIRDAWEYVQQLEAERDAAIRDMTNMAKEYGEPMCEYCGADSDAECRPCYMHNEGFKWRGVQKEG